VVDAGETRLLGGRLTPGVVRVGDTVRRPLQARSDYVHAVLTHLRRVGFDGAPCVLGIDSEGREVLSFIEGEVLDGSPTRFSEARLRSAAGLIRRFHDATAGTVLAVGSEVVCHGDLGHHNIVFQDEAAVGLIDWDDGVAPGLRLVDFAHAVWCLAAVGEAELPVSYQGSAVRAMCDAYGFDQPRDVVGEIAARHRRARDEHALHGRAAAVVVFEQMIARLDAVMPSLTRRL
jgi:tRNA A-37 threonylcarbamoyl transferase component Bud32